MPPVTAPIGNSRLAIALRLMAAYAPDEPTLYELVRRRLLAIITSSEISITETAARAGIHHSVLVRKLLPASDRGSRGMDTETLTFVLTGLGVTADRLVTIEHELADVEVLHHLRALCDAAEAPATSRFLKHAARATVSLSAADASDLWPDAGPRIARLVALGFLAARDDGAYALTPTGRACAAR